PVGGGLRVGDLRCRGLRPHRDADLAVRPVRAAPRPRRTPDRGALMKISGREAIPFPVETVWKALLDPAVLVRTIPGCERLETTAENTYAMTVTAGVAAIRGTYDGTCALSDLAPHESLVMRLQGAGAPGTIDATVHVAFSAPS